MYHEAWLFMKHTWVTAMSHQNNMAALPLSCSLFTEMHKIYLHQAGNYRIYRNEVTLHTAKGALVMYRLVGFWGNQTSISIFE